ncbi:alpha 1,6-mannosyltransferase [Cryptococcus bacillisporus CA1873]|uniref:Alpha 1,6-mannosyltransferase n=1 Tax=Cryptococcus bacillisporus CA1873 TaxID=1296111 RepID=A0ABR5BCI3_CRYGA|nr:alpha 1,6-mannosyltransferase [Cryptococcus bacillisporus CA1873]|eukprot:KIR64011.1 alpha 1,6-mannosyltransferase [Cryptococcus gattii CA1873]
MSFLGWLNRRSNKYSSLPTSNASSGHPNPELFQSSLARRKKLQQIGLGAVFSLLLFGAVVRHSALPQSLATGQNDYEGQGGVPAMTGDLSANPNQKNPSEASGETALESEIPGWTEAMGWKPSSHKGLADLGEIAEQRYKLNVDAEERGTREYFRRLYDFAVTLPMRFHSPFLSSLHDHLPPACIDALPDYPNSQPYLPSMVSYKNIHMTDKTFDPQNKFIQSWAETNSKDGWRINFLDDQQAQDWVEMNFRRTDVEWAWNFMHRGVLKADFLRYLLPLVHGGVYSDVDTQPIRPIEQWGQLDIDYLDLTATDGPSWRTALSTHPSVIVAVDVDVHSKQGWEHSWPRPLGICQWTLSSAPNHPIFLDAVRRVVNASHVVQAWEERRDEEITRLERERPRGWSQEVDRLQKLGRSEVMSVMEWTGPGLFTDSVLAFLLARYNVTWHRLRGLEHPLRIGDVLILPITAFSPGGEKDFRAEGPDSPQANVLHNFRGSWKSDGA